MAIIRIFIRSIVLKKKEKSAWQCLRKSVHVYGERSSNSSRKAEQSGSSQLFPRLSIPPPFFFHVAGRFWIDTKHSRNWNLYCCTGQLLPRAHETGETRIPHRWPFFYRISKPKKRRSRFFSNVHVGIRLKYLSLTPWNAA